MKLALIPPRGYESDALKSDAHLILAQVEHDAYENLYKVACARGELTILDNGANEGPPVDDLVLLSRAMMYGVKEVVVPDVLRDHDQTLRRARQFRMSLMHSTWSSARFNYMGVVQGTTMEEIADCLEGFTHFQMIDTIGVPRHLIDTIGERTVRIQIAKLINERYKGLWEIHFLGTNPSWLAEVLQAAREVPFVRSVDTSAPFNYAVAGQVINLSSPPVGRPDNYFERKREGISQGLIDHNIAVLKEWVRGIR